MRKLMLPAAALAGFLSACGQSSSTPAASAAASAGAAGKPNVLVILVDDLGYADLSAYGSEIATPNIDALAQAGRLLTNFHSTPLCATSRAELLTGVDHHLVGMGTLPESREFYPDDNEYQGNLNDNAPSVAQLLHDAGYHTYMAGKWHLGGGGPVKWGFEQSFSMDYTSAFGNNYAATAARSESAARAYYENGVQAQIPESFFSSDYYVDKLKSYIGAGHGDGKPFFAYLAFQAVHFPLQVPDAYIDLYKGRYDAGYQVIRDARIAKQKALGIVPPDLNPNPGDEAPMLRFGQPGVLTNTAWDQLSASDKQSEARIMEVFAGMLTNLDDNVGRLFAYLKQIGEYDNTLIVFVSDNGADGMGYGFIPYVDSAGNTDIDNSLANYGRPGSFIFRSTRWAEAGNAPLRLFKAFTAEGGISVPAIVRLPRQSSGQQPSAALASLLDVAPTVLAAAGIPDPGAQYQGHAVAPLEGLSLLPVLNGQRSQIYGQDDVIVDEVNDIRYVRKGPWKMTRVVNYMLPSAALLINHDWQLYNMDTDRGETTDLAAQNPALVAELTADWVAYVNRVGVEQPILPPLLTPIDQ
ncbi:MAG TPA: arylsulfatase [Nevskia sp.]|nr:arylsulfatase [Nevskia sp.]